MKKRRLAALLLTLTLAAASAVPAAAESAAFPDVRGSWCESAVSAVCSLGLMEGTAAGRFDPAGAVNQGSLLAMAARLCRQRTGGSIAAPRAGESWYQPYADYLRARLDSGALRDDTGALAGMLDGNGDSTCDRFDLVWIFSAVLNGDALPAVNDIGALPDTDDAAVRAFTAAGVLTGTDGYGTFRGLRTVSRGEAAVVLARIADPSARVRFTQKAYSLSQALLGLPADTPVLTVDGYAVSAETYAAYLANALADYRGAAGDAISWDTPDRGGLTPAEKVRAAALGKVQRLAVLMNHASAYPLTETQQAEVRRTVSADRLSSYSFGLSDAFLTQRAASSFLTANLMATRKPTRAELEAYLAENQELYGQYVLLYRDGTGRAASDAEARSTAQTLRQNLADHVRDREYVAYLVDKYGDEGTPEADVLPLAILSESGRAAASALSTDQVSAVLSEDDGYLVLIRRDPAESETLNDTLAYAPTAALLEQWAAQAVTATTDAYRALRMADIAARSETLL